MHKTESLSDYPHFRLVQAWLFKTQAYLCPLVEQNVFQ